MRWIDMIKIKNQTYVTDEKGKKKAVIISMEEWKKILEDLEELDEIKAYDLAKSQPSEPIKFENAVQQLRKG